MPIFGRKHQRKPGLVVGRSTLGKLDGRQVPARLRVIAVTPPGKPWPVEAALVSGMLLGPFPLEIVQFTVALAKDMWPEPGQELAAVADPANPLIFAVVWGTGDGADESGLPDGLQESTAWDPGPDGTHRQAAAAYLAEAGFFPGDFGPGLDAAAPGMAELLAAECARYVTVVPGDLAVSLAHTGEPAQGVVVQARKLPLPEQLMPNPDACLAWLTLDVTPPDGPPYRTTVRFGFRSAERFVALATPGTHLPLRFNPEDRAQVTLDRPALGITPL
jgi:hypothetical protein